MKLDQLGYDAKSSRTACTVESGAEIKTEVSIVRDSGCDGFDILVIDLGAARDRSQSCYSRLGVVNVIVASQEGPKILRAPRILS